MAIKKLSLKLPGGIRPILQGLVVTYLLLGILTFIAGLIFYFTPLNEIWMHPFGAGIITLSLFFGGRVSAKTAGNKGLYHGVIIGFCFIVITFIFSLSKDLSWYTLGMKSGYALLASIIGGISGVK